MTMMRKDDPNYIHLLLDTNPLAVERAVLAIYRRQTASEQATDSTHESNGIGFNAYDARSAGYWASWISGMKNGMRVGPARHLTGRHLEQARKMMHKYVRQLADIASENLERQAIVEEARYRIASNDSASGYSENCELAFPD